MPLNDEIAKMKLTQAKLYQSRQECNLVTTLAENSGIDPVVIKDVTGIDELRREIETQYSNAGEDERIVVMLCPITYALLADLHGGVKLAIKYEAQVRHHAFIVRAINEYDRLSVMPRLEIIGIYNVEEYVNELSKPQTSINFGG